MGASRVTGSFTVRFRIIALDGPPRGREIRAGLTECAERIGPWACGLFGVSAEDGDATIWRISGTDAKKYHVALYADISRQSLRVDFDFHCPVDMSGAGLLLQTELLCETLGQLVGYTVLAVSTNIRTVFLAV